MCLKQAGHAKSIHPATAALFHNMYLPRSLLTERIRIMDGFLVKRPGFLTTVQDKGRFGYQWSGLSPAGAMDLHSMRACQPSGRQRYGRGGAGNYDHWSDT